MAPHRQTAVYLTRKCVAMELKEFAHGHVVSGKW